jgi:thiosulfate dehydrogenase [quinone] large subunit
MRPFARLSGVTTPAAALLPLRFFLGATFFYAGLDKLLDPAFFDPASPASIHAQLVAFARSSPLAPLIQIAEPYAVPLGVLIALAEIGVGLGALTGLAFRLAAVGGVLLSTLFWLSASWATHPYYYGPDLPYAAGWLTLALVGHGSLLVPQRLLAVDTAPASAIRRAILQTGLLAGSALVVASLTAPLRWLGLDTGAKPSPSPSPTPLGPAPSPRDGALLIATVAQVRRQGSVAFTVPFDAPAPLPAGDPGVIVQLGDGAFAAFDAVCTHAACTVDWDATDAVLLCPCHGAAFDPEHDGAVLAGPTDMPLVALPIVVDAASGSIFLRG